MKSAASQTGKTADMALIYSPEQVDLLVNHLNAKGLAVSDCRVIALDYLSELELKDRGIAFESIEKYWDTTADTDPQLRNIERFVQEWHKKPEFSFFNSQGIALGEIYEIALLFYIETLVYYNNLIAPLLRTATQGKIYLPQDIHSVDTAGPLGDFEMKAIQSVVSLHADASRIEIIPIGKASSATITDSMQDIGKDVFLQAYNSFINAYSALSGSGKKISCFVSSNWNQIETIVRNLPEARFTLMDRKEFNTIPRQDLLKHQFKFRHPASIFEGAEEAEDISRIASFKDAWDNLSKKDMFGTTYGTEISAVMPLIVKALGFLICENSKKIIPLIRSLENIITEEKTDVALLRASVSGQPHFMIIPKICKKLGIPCVEVQHALDDFEKSSPFSKLNASHLAAYGNLTKRMYETNHGYADSQIVVTGSPRFDHIAAQKITSIFPKGRKTEVLCVIPPVITTLSRPHVDSYMLRDYLKDVKKLADACPDISPTLRFRPGHATKTMKKLVSETCGASVKISNEGDAWPLIASSNVIVSGNSTVALQSILLQKPTIIFGLRPGDHMTRDIYSSAGIPCPQDAGALINSIKLITSSQSEFDRQVKSVAAFAKSEFMFDGNAGKQIAQMVRNIIKKP